MKKIYKNKLIEISAIVLISIVFIQIIINSFSLYYKTVDLYHMKKVNNFSKYISDVLHRTQQERGAGAGYLGKPIEEFKTLYLKKIELSNKAMNKLLKASQYCTKISIQTPKIYFNNLKKIRKEVLNNKLSLKKEIIFYSKMNESLLDSMGRILILANNTKMLKSFSAYKNFEMAKEKVGIERAVLSGTFSQNRWNKELYILYVNLLAEQRLLFKLSIEFTNGDIKNSFNELTKSEIFKKVKEKEDIALNKEKNFNVNSLKFYNLITTKINMLNKIIIEMIKSNNKTISDLKSSLIHQFIYQFSINLLLVIFLFYTLFLFHKEHRILFSKSTKDKLTSLYNREMLFEIFPKLIEQSKKNKTKLALFFLDLDGFKNINDTYGHDAGDIVLIETAKRLKNIFRNEDIIVRLGGDEFVISVEFKDYDNLKVIANKIINEITKPIIVEHNISVKVGTSIGISIYPNDAENMEELIKKADEAMYFSKRNGKGVYTFYT